MSEMRDILKNIRDENNGLTVLMMWKAPAEQVSQ